MAAAGLSAPLIGAEAAGAAPAPRRRRPKLAAAGSTPIEHIVVLCQENHSFDTYFGTYKKLPAGYGIPAGYTVGGVAPWHFTDDTDNDNDPYHDWTTIHGEYDDGKMDGFVSENGKNAMGYYDEADLPHYYKYAKEYTLMANYFCGMLSDTYPNRMVLYAGTSGGNTGNSINNGSQDFPCILDALTTGGITFKNYNFHCPSNYSILALWKNWATGGADNELNQTPDDFRADCKNGTLPQVSFVTNEPPYDEHPPENIHTGQNLMNTIIKDVMASKVWDSTAVILTYDEGGGFFDHIAPTQLDAYGPGIRVPTLIISPYAKTDYIDTTFSEHSSVLKFIEYVFDLPALASINTSFNKSTPTTNNATNGAAFPPRDGNAAISNLTQCFNF